jgi:hypothetical protein
MRAVAAWAMACARFGAARRRAPPRARGPGESQSRQPGPPSGASRPAAATDPGRSRLSAALVGALVLFLNQLVSKGQVGESMGKAGVKQRLAGVASHLRPAAAHPVARVSREDSADEGWVPSTQCTVPQAAIVPSPPNISREHCCSALC